MLWSSLKFKSGVEMKGMVRASNGAPGVSELNPENMSLLVSHAAAGGFKLELKTKCGCQSGGGQRGLDRSGCSASEGCRA